MFDKHLIVSITMDEVQDCDPYATAGVAVDETVAAVVALLRRKRTEYVARGNNIGALVVDDITKEFYA